MEETLIHYISSAINEYLKLIDWVFTISYILITYYILNEIKNFKLIKYKSIISLIIAILYSTIYLLLDTNITKENIKTIIFSIIFSMFFYSIIAKYLLRYISKYINVKKI